MKVYRGTDGDVTPVEMEAEVCGYPNYTTAPERELMHDNTHFRTEAEAWESILSSVRAGVSLAGGTVERHRADLAKAERHAGDAAVEFKTAHDNYRAWLGRKAGEKCP